MNTRTVWVYKEAEGLDWDSSYEVIQADELHAEAIIEAINTIGTATDSISLAAGYNKKDAYDECVAKHFRQMFT